MPLLDELIAQNLIEENTLTHLGPQFRQSRDIESLRQLTKQQLIDENQLLPFFLSVTRFPC
jgi:hypothetical protein